MKRQESLENKHEKIERDYVTYKHLDAVVNPIQRMAEEIQKDVKKLLMLMGPKKNESGM